MKKVLCLAAILAVAGCATERPKPVTSAVVSTNSFINAPEWSGFKEPVETLMRTAFTNNCTAKVILTRVDGNSADVRVIEIHPTRKAQ